MKTRITLLLVLLTFVLLSAGAGAWSAPGYRAETATLAGGAYRLTSVGPAAPVSVGGAYRLLGPAAPAAQGSGCCCTYLPCLQRNQ